MTQWTVCPACGLRHSRAPDPCPRCRSGGAGGQARVAASASAAAPGAGQADAKTPRRATAILAMIGVALLGAVVSQVARRAGAAAVSRIHWRDPALVKAEEALEHELAMLRSLHQSLEAYRASAAEDARALEARAAVLERAASSLADVSVNADVELEARIPPRMQGSWTTTSIRVRAGRDASQLGGVVARLPLPEGAWVEAARCSGEGCSLVVSAATWARAAPPSRAVGAGRTRQLPPRPWWPPSAEVWDRVSQGSEEAATLVTAVNELAPLREVHEAAQLLELVATAARNEAHRPPIVSVVDAAVAAGITDVEVTRAQNGVQVQVPRRSPELVARLGVLGQVWEERGSESAVTYGLVFARNQPRSYTRTSELPAGYSLGF